jgi:hypothetical protein
MKNESRIIALSSRFDFPLHSPEEVSNKKYWTGNRPTNGIEKSSDISAAGFECVLFSSAFSALTGTFELIQIHSDPAVVGRIQIPVKACFLLTFIKSKKNNSSLIWTSSLS